MLDSSLFFVQVIIISVLIGVRMAAIPKIINLIELELYKNRDIVVEEVRGLVNDRQVYWSVIKLLGRGALTEVMDQNLNLAEELHAAHTEVVALRGEIYNLKKGIVVEEWNKVRKPFEKLKHHELYEL